MIPKPLISVVLASRFRQDIKRLLKKYRHVREDVQTLITQLEQGDTPGDRIQNTHYLVYKLTLRSL